MATKEEIAQNKQFLFLSPCFQLYSIIVLSFKGSFHSIIVLSFKGSFHTISGMFSKSSAAETFLNLFYKSMVFLNESVVIKKI